MLMFSSTFFWVGIGAILGLSFLTLLFSRVILGCFAYLGAQFMEGVQSAKEKYEKEKSEHFLK